MSGRTSSWKDTEWQETAAADWGPFDSKWVGGEADKIEVDAHGGTLVSLTSGAQGYIAPGIPLEALAAWVKKLEAKVARRERADARQARLAAAAAEIRPQSTKPTGGGGD